MYNVFRNELLSEEWCNMLFAGRNKAYGAYQLRATAGRRYAYALLGLFAFALLALGLPLVGWQMVDAVENLFDDGLPVIELKPLPTEKDHERKLVAAGRSIPPRPVAPPGEALEVPEIAEEVTASLDLGTELPKSVIVEEETFVPVLPEDHLHNLTREDLPEEGPMLTPVEVVETMPQFPGGLSALMRFLDEHTSYPASCIRQKVEGEVVVTFLVDQEGNLLEPTVEKALHPALDAACLAAVRQMPKWKPGKLKGRDVLVKVKLPVRFQL